MKIQKVIIFVFLLAIALGACAPDGVGPSSPVNSNTPPAPSVQTPPAQTPPDPQTKTPGAADGTAVSAAVAALVKESGIAANQVKISTVEAVEWPNACLGAQKAGEMCAEVITSGYQIILEASGKTYEYHTNLDGSQVRKLDTALPHTIPTTSAGQTPVQGDARSAAQNALAQQLGLAADQVKVVTVEPVQWRDGCLEVNLPGRMCTQVITPGYRVILEAAGKQYEYHTNESGTTVLPAQPPASPGSLPGGSGSSIIWEQEDNGACSRAEISAQRVAYGACGGALKEAALAPARVVEFQKLAEAYSSFQQDTPAGSVEFSGTGQANPTTAQMRSTAEWARLVSAEAQGKDPGKTDLAFNWHREGGIAAFCDDMTVSRAGFAQAASCKGGLGQAIEPYLLSAGELEKLYAWLDQLASFDYEHKDAPVVDAMLVRLSLVGSGTRQATPQQQEEIAGFAGQVYANARNR